MNPIATLLHCMFATFVTLKIIGVNPVSGWSWWVVTSPWWAPIATGIALYFLLIAANVIFMIYLRFIGYNQNYPFQRLYAETEKYKFKKIFWEWLFLTNTMIYSGCSALIGIFIRDRSLDGIDD